MLASVAKAQTLASDKALILCIAGGKHCDAETARQPAPARARCRVTRGGSNPGSGNWWAGMTNEKPGP